MGLLEDLKIAIFAGINDTPKAASEIEPGNGSDLINRLNQLIDRINPFISEKWGDVVLFLDASFGDDSNDGLAPETSVKTVSRLLEIIASKTIDKTLTIIYAATPLVAFDLDGIKAEPGGVLNIFHSHSFSAYPDASDNPSILFVNVPNALKLSLEGFLVRFSRTSRIEEIKKLSLTNCTFLSAPTFKGRLLNIWNIEEVTISNCSFFGNENGLESYQLISCEGIKNLNFIELQAHSSYDTPFNISRSDVSISGYIYNYLADNPYSQYFMSANESIVTIEGYTQIAEKRIKLRNSFIRNKNFLQNNQHTFCYFFPSLTDEVVVLMPQAYRHFTIKNLNVADNNSSAVYDLTISNVQVAKKFDDAKRKSFDLNDTNNNIIPALSSLLQLVVTGTATNVTVQVDLLETDNDVDLD
jgi:hypothetical protein